MPPPDRQDDGAIDLWLRESLQESYGKVLREPVPEALLALLRDPGR